MKFDDTRKALYACSQSTGGCHNCPYRSNLPTRNCVRILICDAKAIIDAQNDELRTLACKLETAENKLVTNEEMRKTEVERLKEIIYHSVSKKPIKKNLTWRCPSCDEKLKSKHQNYCSKCGQLINTDIIL